MFLDNLLCFHSGWRLNDFSTFFDSGSCFTMLGIVRFSHVSACNMQSLLFLRRGRGQDHRRPAQFLAYHDGSDDPTHPGSGLSAGPWQGPD